MTPPRGWPISTSPQAQWWWKIRGIWRVERMQRRCSQGVQTIVSYRSDLVVFDEQGHRLDVLCWLHQRPGHGADRRIRWQGCWYRLVAVPLSPESIERKRQDIRATAHKHGRQPTPQALALAAWHLILTTLPEEFATTDQIATLMRLRWQIELLVFAVEGSGQTG